MTFKIDITDCQSKLIEKKVDDRSKYNGHGITVERTKRNKMTNGRMK